MIKKLSAAALVVALAIAVPMGAAAKEHKKRESGGSSSGTGDLIKAVAGLTAIAIIANEVKKGKKAKQAAAEAAAAAAKAKQGPQVCGINPYWDGVSWRNRDGRVCLPTPAVCLRETILSNRTVRRFDYECMWNEGFRLSSVDK